MTKKSHGRQVRDEFKRTNTGWDDLSKIYLGHQSCLNHIVKTTKAFFAIKGIHQYIPLEQADYASGLIHGLASDVRSFQTRLNDLYKRHSHMTGMFVFDESNPGSYVQFTAVSSDYVQYGMDYSTILEPMYRQALGLIASIEKNIESQTTEGRARLAAEAQKQQTPQPDTEPTAVTV